MNLWISASDNMDLAWFLETFSQLNEKKSTQNYTYCNWNFIYGRTWLSETCSKTTKNSPKPPNQASINASSRNKACKKIRKNWKFSMSQKKIKCLSALCFVLLHWLMFYLMLLLDSWLFWSMYLITKSGLSVFRLSG